MITHRGRGVKFWRRFKAQTFLSCKGAQDVGAIGEAAAGATLPRSLFDCGALLLAETADLTGLQDLSGLICQQGLQQRPRGPDGLRAVAELVLDFRR